MTEGIFLRLSVIKRAILGRHCEINDRGIKVLKLVYSLENGCNYHSHVIRMTEMIALVMEIVGIG